MELDADEPRKFQGPPDRILGPADVGGGGGGGGAAKAKILQRRRDLSALGPFGPGGFLLSRIISNYLELSRRCRSG